MSGNTPAELIELLEDEATRLAGRSIEHGCVDSGIASNLASEAADQLTVLTARVAELEDAAREMIEANRKARNMVPDEEEGVAAQVFCYHINAADTVLSRTVFPPPPVTEGADDPTAQR